MPDKETDTNEPVDTEGALAIRVPEHLDPRSKKTSVWFSSVPVTPIDKAKLVNMLGGSLPKLSEVVNRTIMVKDIGRQAVELTDKDTHEVFPGVRTIIVCDDGTAYGTVSKGIGGSLNLIFGIWGLPPWKPPLPLTVKQLEISGNKRLYQLEIATEFIGGKKGK